jgi:hypothetical protein
MAPRDDWLSQSPSFGQSSHLVLLVTRSREGLLRVVHVLGLTPVIGTAKNVLEIFTGDLIPDKADRKKRNAKMSDRFSLSFKPILYATYRLQRRFSYLIFTTN